MGVLKTRYIKEEDMERKHQRELTDIFTNLWFWRSGQGTGEKEEYFYSIEKHNAFYGRLKGIYSEYEQKEQSYNERDDDDIRNGPTSDELNVGSLKQGTSMFEQQFL